MMGHFTFAQVNFSIMAGGGLPQKTLRELGYPKSGGGLGMSLSYNTSKASLIGLEFGWQTYYSSLGSKTYTFGADKDELYHQAWMNNATSRLVFKLGVINPYVGYGAGFLSTSVKESVSNDCADCGAVNHTLRNVLTYNQNFSGGLLIRLAPGVNLDLSTNYLLGGKTKFIDFSKVNQTADYIYFDYKESKVFDYLTFNIGVSMTFDEMKSSGGANSTQSPTTESSGSDSNDQNNTGVSPYKKEEKCTPEKKPKSHVREGTPTTTPTRESKTE